MRRTTETEDDSKHMRWTRHRLISTHYVSRKLDPPIMLADEEVKRHFAPQAEFVDVETGEILIGRGVYVGERCLQRDYLLNRCLRPEVRHFAQFVLKFRNNRMGISPGVGELVKWYAEVYDLRPDNVRRYVPRLQDVGILENDNLLGRLFQFYGGDMLPSEHLQESVNSHSRYAVMLMARERLQEERQRVLGKLQLAA